MEKLYYTESEIQDKWDELTKKFLILVKKHPNRLEGSDKEYLTKLLKFSLRVEDYEASCILRDKIKQLN